MTLSDRTGYFSRIKLRDGGTSSREFWNAFRNPYSLHQSIWQLFADHPERSRDFLYNVSAQSQPPVIYAVSMRPPAGADPLWQVECKTYLPRLRVGMRLEFLLRANPVVTRDGKRHDIVMDAKKVSRFHESAATVCRPQAEIVQELCELWLRKRADASGFLPLTVRADGYQQHLFAKRKQQQPVRFSTVEFAGIIEVTDPQRMMTTLYEGVGPAKGFGCGLMLIKRSSAEGSIE